MTDRNAVWEDEALTELDYKVQDYRQYLMSLAEEAAERDGSFTDYGETMVPKVTRLHVVEGYEADW